MKKILFLCCVTLASCGAKSVKVGGVVTYFFNDNYGQKPDVGAEVMFLSEEKLSQKDGDSLRMFIDKWAFSKISPNHLSHMAQIAVLDAQAAVNKTETISSDTSALYEVIEATDRAKAYDYFSDLMVKAGGKELKATANGNGEYSATLPIGKYYVFVRFSHRDAIYMDRFQEITEDKNLSYEFKRVDIDL